MTTTEKWMSLPLLDTITIKLGNHPKPNGGVEACAMEAAYLRWAIKQGWSKTKIVAGWTDSLDCVCPMIGGFVRRWNDAIADDAVRTRIFSPDLLDLLPGTKGDDVLLLRRMWLAIDWDLRTRTPAFLRLAKLDACAVAIEALPPITSQAQLNDARAVFQNARTKASAARAAAWDAAWEAAGYAARAVAGDAAWDAAWEAAWAAAGAAAWDAAWAAARDRLTPTVEAMQASAKQLVVRMCAEK
jgi:hypothetical protein